MKRRVTDHAAVERIDELKRAGDPVTFEDVKAALRESDEWWSAIFDAAGIAFVFGDADGRILYASPSVQKVFGYTPEELLDIGSIMEMTHPDDLPLDIELFGELIQGTRDHYQMDKRYKHKNGMLIWGRLTVLLLRDADDQPKFVVGMAQDVSESRRAQQMSEQLAAATLRREQALELNDNIVQGLVVAKMALEGGLDDKAKQTLAATLETAKGIVSELLGTMERDPGTLVRGEPANTASNEGSGAA